MNKQYFVRYNTVSGHCGGILCFGNELQEYLNAILNRGDIITGVEYYLE